jgi:hypothetical protein
MLPQGGEGEKVREMRGFLRKLPGQSSRSRTHFSSPLLTPFWENCVSALLM